MGSGGVQAPDLIISVACWWRGKSVDKVIEEADAVKRGRYAKLFKDSDVLFFTFGMDAEGQEGERAEDTIRYFTNRLTGDQVKRDIFRRY